MPPIEVIRVEGQNEGYRRWIKDGSTILKERLPFKGPAHLAITIGSSGMDSLTEAMHFREPPVEIPFEEIGLPIGENKAHPKKILAGITQEGKNIVIVQGRTHEYEVKGGINTASWGNLTAAELATGYLGMLNEVGVENMVLTNAAGSINHPLLPGQAKPFSESDVPIISLIGSDFDMAYLNRNLGDYKSKMDDFFSLKDADPSLMDMFRKCMVEIDENTTVPTVHYVTSPSTPNFEDPGVIYTVAKLGGQVVGMSYSPEKQFLSGLKGIGRFIGISVITNLQELEYAEESYDHIISVEEMAGHRPWEFKRKFAASDAEVRENGKKVQEKLSRALSKLAQSL